MPHLTQITRRSAMIAGVLSSIVYVTIDMTSASRYPGYSLVDHAISELSAVGAPATSTELWQLLGPTYGVLFALFALGVLITGRGNRWLTVSAWLMLAFVAWGVMWPFFPMHQRGAERNLSDVGHLVLGGGSLALMTAFIATGAFSLGDRFKRFSVITGIGVLLAGLATFAYVPVMAADRETPFLGVVERVMIYGYLLWIATLAIALMRGDSRQAFPR
jgi:hypothetical protein